MTQDSNIEIARLQTEIGSYIGLGTNHPVYAFEEDGNRVMLRLITINPRHNQSFLFHTTAGGTIKEALGEMLAYVKDYKDKESSYTIQWTAKGENVLHTSYFRAKNVLGALDKLYYDRDPNSITVFSVSLNPVS